MKHGITVMLSTLPRLDWIKQQELNIKEHSMAEICTVGCLTCPRSSPKTAIKSTHDTAECFFIYISWQTEINNWKQQFLSLWLHLLSVCLSDAQGCELSCHAWNSGNCSLRRGKQEYYLEYFYKYIFILLIIKVTLYCVVFNELIAFRFVFFNKI